ncbi:MAG TPA: hypothetical protein VFD82_24675 [Planctomycetota bacterium]|nr:hypothetical protein [Planctomycetota bacterium]
MTRSALILLLCALLAGCAFTRRENRPVWNAFEQNLVPEDKGWFVVALPLTVPGGILAIVADTFVAHPIQVADDAWDDAAWLWRDGRPDFDERYYSEMAFLPVRTAITPVTFLGSFLGRSMFVFDTEADVTAQREQRQAAARARFAAWLGAVQQGGGEPFHEAVPELDDALGREVVVARKQANALGRMQLYRLALVSERLRALVDPSDGLRDADPVVRWSVLQSLPDELEVAAELQQQLRNDAVETVRLRARKRWPEPP